jgi:hypothetical protein
MPPNYPLGCGRLERAAAACDLGKSALGSLASVALSSREANPSYAKIT